MNAPRAALAFSRIEFQIRDQGTFLGFLWTLLNPLSTFLVLYFIFKPSFSGSIRSFDSYLLSGIIIWNFFSVSTQSAASVLMRRPQYLNASAANPAAYVMGAILSILYASIIEIFLGACVLQFLGQSGPSFAAGAFLGILLVFPIAFGSGLILCALSTIFIDTLHLWSLVLRLGFFMTPVFYPLESLSAAVRNVVRFNPMLYPISISRGVPASALGFHTDVEISCLAGAVSLLLGLLLFSRFRYRFVEVL